MLELTKADLTREWQRKNWKLCIRLLVLVIDDIGVQMSKEWSDTVFYRLVNARYNNRLVTIYTSNQECKNLKMDERIIDRIESTTYPVPLPEEPIRSRKRAEKRSQLMEQIKNAPV